MENKNNRGFFMCSYRRIDSLVFPKKTFFVKKKTVRVLSKCAAEISSSRDQQWKNLELFQVSKVILDNHQLSPYKSESSSNHDSSGWETVQNCEQLLSLTQAMCEEAKQISSRLSDKVSIKTIFKPNGNATPPPNLNIQSRDKESANFAFEHLKLTHFYHFFV